MATPWTTRQSGQALLAQGFGLISSLLEGITSPFSDSLPEFKNIMARPGCGVSKINHF